MELRRRPKSFIGLVIGIIVTPFFMWLRWKLNIETAGGFLLLFFGSLFLLTILYVVISVYFNNDD